MVIVIFGYLGKFCKISETTLTLRAQVLRQVEP